MLSRWKEACMRHGWMRAEVLELFRAMNGSGGASELPKSTSKEDPFEIEEGTCPPRTVQRDFGWSGSVEDADTSGDEREAQRLLEEALATEVEADFPDVPPEPEEFPDVEIVEVLPLPEAIPEPPFNVDDVLPFISDLFIKEIVAESDSIPPSPQPPSPRPATPVRALSFSSTEDSSPDASKAEEPEVEILATHQQAGSIAATVIPPEEKAELPSPAQSVTTGPPPVEVLAEVTQIPESATCVDLTSPIRIPESLPEEPRTLKRLHHRRSLFVRPELEESGESSDGQQPHWEPSPAPTALKVSSGEEGEDDGDENPDCSHCSFIEDEAEESAEQAEVEEESAEDDEEEEEEEGEEDQSDGLDVDELVAHVRAAATQIAARKGIQTPKVPKKPAKAKKVFKNFKRDRDKLLHAVHVNIDRIAFGGRLSPDVVTVSWSKALHKTAGDCEHTKTPDGRPGATIRIATKVCDTYRRMKSTLAHELCHAAVFIIDGQPDAPSHGKLFKKWGRLVQERYGEEITTTHNYVLHYRVTYACKTCGRRFGRHSKSIDTSQAVCACGGQLELVSTSGSRTVPKTPSAYIEFTKAHFSEVRKSNPGIPHREIMTRIAAMWRTQKAKENSTTPLQKL